MQGAKNISQANGGSARGLSRKGTPEPDVRRATNRRQNSVRPAIFGRSFERVIDFNLTTPHGRTGDAVPYGTKTSNAHTTSRFRGGSSSLTFAFVDYCWQSVSVAGSSRAEARARLALARAKLEDLQPSAPLQPQQRGAAPDQQQW